MRRSLHRRGLRYRVDFAPLTQLRRRRADVVFTRARVAVFIDGCWWHGCPEHFRAPKRNREWWLDKIGTNRQRDQATDEALRAAGWSVVRAWEHEDPDAVADAVERLVRERSQPVHARR